MSCDNLSFSPTTADVDNDEPSPNTTYEEANRASSSNEEASPNWKGVSLDEILINDNPYRWEHLPPVRSSKNQAILFELPAPKKGPPKPYPDAQVDKWAAGYVRLPHSPHSLYAEDGETDPRKMRKRWEVIEEALIGSLTSSMQIEHAILSYNHAYADKWDFQALHHFFDEHIDKEEVEMCFATLIPKMTQLALRLPNLLTGIIPLLPRHHNAFVSLSQLQVASLLANAFFCTFPRRNTPNPKSEYANYPHINFNKLFGTSPCQTVLEKLRCIFHYFRRVTSKEPEGVITIYRKCIPRKEFPRWDKQIAKLPPMHITSEGTIETEGAGLLQVDFANKFLGGGVLNYGCVQEEIRFVICPELLVTMLVAEALDDNEALVIQGVERYSQYSGYRDTFEWVGDFVDETPRDKSKRRKTCVVAIDALFFRQKNLQYGAKNIIRELNKAYAGFHSEFDLGPIPAVATGNWGCGAFRGDPELKSLIQLMSAGVAGRSLVYFTFGDRNLRDRIARMYENLVTHNITIGHLFTLICQYQEESDKENVTFYQFLSVQSKIKPLTCYFSKKNHSIDEKTNVTERKQFDMASHRQPSIAKLQEEEREREIEDCLNSIENESSGEDETPEKNVKKIDEITGSEKNESNYADDKSAIIGSTKRGRATFNEIFGEQEFEPAKKRVSQVKDFYDLLMNESNDSGDANSRYNRETVDPSVKAKYEDVDVSSSSEKSKESPPSNSKNTRKTVDPKIKARFERSDDKSPQMKISHFFKKKE